MRSVGAGAAVLGALAALALGCAREPVRASGEPAASVSASATAVASAVASGSASVVASASPSAGAAGNADLPPLGAAGWMEPLALPEGRSAVATVPLGARGPRPVVVGVHGAGDRPEWACGGYRLVTADYPFVVCPRGLPSGDVFVTAPPKQLGADIDAALAALRARFGAYVAEGPVVYAGFSLGAIHAAKVLSERSDVQAAVLVEGGYENVTDYLARRFRDKGGQRMLLVCASTACGIFATTAARYRAAGLDVKVTAAATGKHNLDGEMIAKLSREWGFVVADDPRWRGWSG